LVSIRSTFLAASCAFRSNVFTSSSCSFAAFDETPDARITSMGFKSVPEPSFASRDVVSCPTSDSLSASVSERALRAVYNVEGREGGGREGNKISVDRT
jgi:hypothetical protein